MDREKLFEEFKSQCVGREQICGQGNPNADILIIGKEPHGKICKNRQEYLDHLNKNYEHCRVNVFVRMSCKHLDYYKQKYQDYNVARENFRKLTTWKNYQKLLFEIKGIKYHENDNNVVDFERFAYTTELSSMPRPQADYDASKDMINKRLLFFKESKFIQSFPVIILACREYIHNDEDRQIDNTFGVTFRTERFITPTTERITSPTFRFYTHYNEDDSKLVIHTRQLSNFRGNGDQLLKEMATVIRKHLRIE